MFSNDEFLTAVEVYERAHSQICGLGRGVTLMDIRSGGRIIKDALSCRFPTLILCWISLSKSCKMINDHKDIFIATTAGPLDVNSQYTPTLVASLM